ncbi:hypothetical protein LB523_28180 [Mesorhizobium sp. ESP-6-4]|uniref:hypothetical protein n=1 Tax=Mesorhizobium sp. ESP-6-4 TaxID=2876624 RepID=UPI001CCF76A3|nr:hypothetical protein [Mesorhizobium sp. ESP-6-4]MBZ9662934.1 hypothetical protein [Mesorhizobium sp. ESP-6-4]
MRALLFSTGKRGRVAESLFLRVHHGEQQTEFSFWGMGDKDLVRGSGLFVPETGIATNHHFNPLDADELFVFQPGIYSIELVAKLLGRRKLTSLWRIPLQIPDGAFGDDITPDTAVFFNWSAETGRYVASVESRPGQPPNSPALGTDRRSKPFYLGLSAAQPFSATSRLPARQVGQEG